MGLQVWLPLNGNLDNQGLSDQTSNITTTPIWSSIGKIGGKSLYTKTQMTTMYFPGLVGVSTYSVAYWVYIPTAIAPTAWVDIFGIQFNCGGTTIWERDERTYSDTNGQHQYCLAKSASEGSTTNPYYALMVDSRAKDNWVHTVLVKDDANAKLYINGILHGTYQSIDFENSPRTMTGNVCLGTSGCEAYLQDFRIYDHALSPREVKEISKGLVLHYSLSGSGGGCENLMKDSNFSITSGLNASTVKIATLIPVGTTITVSVQVDADDVVWDSSSNYRRVGTEFYAPKSGTTDNQYFGAWAGQELSSSGNVVEAFTGSFHGRVSKTFTTLGEVPALRNVGLYIQGVTSGTVRVSNPKVEIGSVATPWVPNTADTEYATMGFNDGIEYDVSGYGHNGTKTGTFAYDADTPRYNVSTFFKAGDGIFGHPNITLSQFTIAFWGKHTVIGKMLFGSNSSSTNTNSDWYWYGDKSFKFPLGEFYYSHNAGSDTDLLNMWTHFAAIYNGAKLVIYRNGIYEGEKAFTGNVTLQDISIGRGLDGNYREDGYVSDFRLYATALSADDVMALYHTPISLANNGTLLTQGEYVES